MKTKTPTEEPLCGCLKWEGEGVCFENLSAGRNARACV